MIMSNLKTPSGLPKSRGFCYNLLGEPPYGMNKNLVAKLMLFFPLFETGFQNYTYVIMLLTLFFFPCPCVHNMAMHPPSRIPHIYDLSGSFSVGQLGHGS